MYSTIDGDISSTTSTTNLTIWERKYYEIDPSNYVYFPSLYMKAYMWKDNPKLQSLLQSTFRNITNKDDFISVLKDQSLNNGQESTLKIGAILYNNEDDRAFYKRFIRDFLKFHNISHVQPLISYTTYNLGTCQPNVFDVFDIVISTNFMFYQLIRVHRSGDRKSQGFYSISDFSSIYLEPLVIFQGNRKELTLSDFNSYKSRGQFYERPNCLNQNTLNIVANYESSVEYDLRILSGENGTFFHSSELKFLNQFNKEVLQLVPQNVSNSWMKQIIQFYNINDNDITSNNTLIYQSFLIPECAVCKADFCEDFNFYEVDYWIIPMTLLVIIHYIVLFTSKAFMTPALKIRLLVPYMPIFALYFEVQSILVFGRSCAAARFIVVGYLITWYLLTYSFTIFRVYYLRNLYHFISSSGKSLEDSKQRIRFQRKIVNPWVGALITCGAALLFALILGSPFLLIISYVDDIFRNRVLIINALIGFYFGLGCLIGGIAIIIDLIINRQKLKEKGLRHILFFDDPFLIRLEVILLSLVIIFIILITIFTGAGNGHVERAFRFVIYVIVILNSGLLTSFKHIITQFSNRKSHNEASKLEVYLRNDAFKILMREYCVKEMSVENYNCYIFLEQIRERKDQTIDLETIKEFERNFISVNSIYELNIPSQVRKSFHQLLKQVEDLGKNNNNSPPPKYSDLLETLLFSILTNLGDTHNRLESTKEYKVWQEVYEIQAKSSIH
ncbi:predicted protein [Naegleria gruberi]|uniref:Predicted protein n=1 Tax=Naegleria gruberi TaxID=5762 RepID=D2VKB4_NAEGR|nr:uncharacterized protein NAEGRDRAFT_69334 [Naegleria gruberi]EFC42570.1 predicted protein [Naegleria gruberi]|eukprot:XP_002675314.1 predicted protein [Naegleria gruberi strain NEG-M]